MNIDATTLAAIRGIDGGADLLSRLRDTWHRIRHDLRAVPWMDAEDVVHTALAAHLEGRDGVREVRTLLQRLWRRSRREEERREALSGRVQR